VKAFVDSREPGIIKTTLNMPTKELDQGDFYMPEYDVAIERKEAGDFCSSLTDGRLSKQADRMAANHDHAFLIIEGDPYEVEYSDVSNNSISGMMSSLAVKRGISILYASNISQTMYHVKRVFERFADEEHERADGGYVKTADTGEVDDVQVAMLAQVEGISVEKGMAINNEIYSVANIVKEPHSTKKRLLKVDGVGDKLADRVINAFQ